MHRTRLSDGFDCQPYGHSINSERLIFTARYEPITVGTKTDTRNSTLVFERVDDCSIYGIPDNNIAPTT